MRFLVDAQLPPALARWLEERGHEAKHVIDLALQDAPDEAIWRHASTKGAVIVSKDEDFARRRALTSDGPQVVWLRVGNTNSRTLIEILEEILDDLVRALASGETLVEVRRR